MEDTSILFPPVLTFGLNYTSYGRTKFRLGGPIGGIYKVLGGTYSGIYYKFSPGSYRRVQASHEVEFFPRPYAL